MWHLKPTLIPIVEGAIGRVKTGTNKYLQQIPGKPSLTEIQKIVLTSAAHILRKRCHFKSVTKYVWTISIQVIPIIYLQLLFMYTLNLQFLFFL